MVDFPSHERPNYLVDKVSAYVRDAGHVVAALFFSKREPGGLTYPSVSLVALPMPSPSTVSSQ